MRYICSRCGVGFNGPAIPDGLPITKHDMVCSRCVLEEFGPIKPPTGGEDDMDPNELGRYPDEEVGHQ